MPFLSPYLTPVLLLTGSNVFMTAAWYWHLRLAVPANRFGSAVYSPAQLTTLQDHLRGFCCLLIFLFARTDHPEPGFRLRADRGGRILRLSEVVKGHFAGATRKMRPAELSVSR